MFKRYLPYIAALVTVTMWASAYPFARYALSVYTPRGLILARFLVATATLLVVNIIASKGKPRLPDRVDVPWFIMSGFLGIFVYTWLFHEGLERVDAGVASFIMAFNPVIVMVLSVLVLKEPIRRRGVIGFVISMAGLVLVTLTQAEGFEINPGVFFLFIAACVIATYPILQRRLLRKYSPIQTASYCIAAGTAFMIAFAGDTIDGLLASNLGVHLMVLYLGAFPAALGFFLWGYALSKIDNTLRITNFLYLMPFIASLSAFVVLGEVITLMELLGGTIIILGMLVANGRARRSA